jgi:hypothetical protein
VEVKEHEEGGRQANHHTSDHPIHAERSPVVHRPISSWALHMAAFLKGNPAKLGLIVPALSWILNTPHDGGVTAPDPAKNRSLMNSELPDYG